MSKDDSEDLPSIRLVVINVILVVGLLIVVFLVEQVFDANWYWLGVKPRALVGVLGLFTSPMKHANLSHLLNNLLLLAILCFAFFTHFHLQKPFQKIILISIICNVWLWIVGRDSWHFGASGVVYGLFFYLLYIAVIHKRIELYAYLLSCLMLSIGFFTGLFPGQPNVSFESHILGGIAGVLVAFFEKKQKKHKKPTNNISFTSGKGYNYEFKEKKK